MPEIVFLTILIILLAIATIAPIIIFISNYTRDRKTAPQNNKKRLKGIGIFLVAEILVTFATLALMCFGPEHDSDISPSTFYKTITFTIICVIWFITSIISIFNLNKYCKTPKQNRRPIEKRINFCWAVIMLAATAYILSQLLL